MSDPKLGALMASMSPEALALCGTVFRVLELQDEGKWTFDSQSALLRPSANERSKIKVPFRDVDLRADRLLPVAVALLILASVSFVTWGAVHGQLWAYIVIAVVAVLFLGRGNLVFAVIIALIAAAAIALLIL
jgi:hypothetical protein